MPLRGYEDRSLPLVPDAVLGLRQPRITGKWELKIVRPRYSSAPVSLAHHQYGQLCPTERLRHSHSGIFPSDVPSYSSFIYYALPILLFSLHQIAAFWPHRFANTIIPRRRAVVFPCSTPLASNIAFIFCSPRMLISVNTSSKHNLQQCLTAVRSRLALFSSEIIVGDITFGRVILVCPFQEPHSLNNITDFLTPRLKMAST